VTTPAQRLVRTELEEDISYAALHAVAAAGHGLAWNVEKHEGMKVEGSGSNMGRPTAEQAAVAGMVID